MKRTFRIEDILTVTTGRLVSECGFDALYDLLGFLVGEVPLTHQIPRVIRICTPHLLRQFPQLGGPEVDREVARLHNQIRGAVKDRAPVREILAAWRRDVAAKLGAEFEVADLPEELRDPGPPAEGAADQFWERVREDPA